MYRAAVTAGYRSGVVELGEGEQMQTRHSSRDASLMSSLRIFFPQESPVQSNSRQAPDSLLGHLLE